MDLDVERLYVEHHGNLRGFVVNRLGTAGDDDRVDDLCADVWARAWEKRHQYRDRGHDPKSWLFTIAQHELIDEYRRLGAKHRPIPVPLDHVDAWRATSDAGSDRHLDAISARSDLALLLDGAVLTDEQRRVVECRFLLDLSEKQTEAATGLTFNGVKKLQARALANLRKRAEAAA